MSLPGDAARARGVATSGPVVSEPLGSEPGVSEAGAGRVVTADEGRAGAAQDRYERRQLVGVGGMGRVLMAKGDGAHQLRPGSQPQMLAHHCRIERQRPLWATAQPGGCQRQQEGLHEPA